MSPLALIALFLFTFFAFEPPATILGYDLILLPQIQAYVMLELILLLKKLLVLFLVLLRAATGEKSPPRWAAP